jgi:hypothetical protein
MKKKKLKIKNLKLVVGFGRKQSCRPHKPTNDGLLESPDINESLDVRGG